MVKLTFLLHTWCVRLIIFWNWNTQTQQVSGLLDIFEGKPQKWTSVILTTSLCMKRNFKVKKYFHLSGFMCQYSFGLVLVLSYSIVLCFVIYLFSFLFLFLFLFFWFTLFFYFYFSVYNFSVFLFNFCFYFLVLVFALTRKEKVLFVV